MVKGGIKYVPKEFIEELEDMKKNWGMKNDSECIREIIKNSRLAREIKIKINFKGGL